MRRSLFLIGLAYFAIIAFPGIYQVLQGLAAMRWVIVQCRLTTSGAF